MSALKIGKSDVLEREYMQLFRQLASKYGEFVVYERDRAGRDIGLHLTRPTAGGGETVTTTLRWFQMKGVAETTLSASEIAKLESVRLALEVKHLKFWYQLPDPTYLVVYLQATREFLVMDVQKFIQERWGDAVLELAQKEATVEVPIHSVLDEDAFQQILARSDAEWLERFCSASPRNARLAVRDCDLILAIGDASTRHAQVEALFRDWISKTRSEIHFSEVSPTGAPKPLQVRWVHMFSITEIEEHLPWLTCFQVARHIDSWMEDDAAAEEEGYEPWDEESGEYSVVELPSGIFLYGEEASGEYVEYRFYERLNELGEVMLDWINRMRAAGQMTGDPSAGEFVSVAPWDARNV